MTWKVLRDYKLNALICSVAIATLGYLAFSIWGGWSSVISAFGDVGMIGFLVILSFSLVNYGLRFLRWQLYLSVLGHPMPIFPSILIYIAGFSLTTTPGKAGEMIRCLFLKARGMPYKLSAAAFLSERMSDLIAIVLLSLLGVSLYPYGNMAIFSGVFVIIIGLLLLYKKNWLMALANTVSRRTGRLANLVHQFLLLLIEACCCHTPNLLLSTITLSLLAWSAEAYAFHLVLSWMKVDVSLTFAFFVYAVSSLAGALSFLPGGLGGAEAAMIGLLVWAGMNEAEAVAATIVIRLATLWFAVALGGLALLFGGRTLNDSSNFRDS